LIRYDIRNSITAGEQLIGLSVVDKMFILGIKRQGSSGAIGNVGQMDQRGRSASLLDFRKQIVPLPASNEAVQPKLMQFKGNIGDMDEAQRQADALRSTIEFFGRGSESSSSTKIRHVPPPKMGIRPRRDLATR
jgi:hypothetical protein